MSFLNKRFIFKKNKNYQIIILSKDLRLKNFDNINISFEIINIYYLFAAIKYFLFKNKDNQNLKSIYLKIFISSFKPKIIIGNNVDLKIFKIKKIFPNITCICYQFGYVTDKTAKKLYKNNKFFCDYFLAFHKDDIKILKKNIISKFIVAGSIKNNSTPKKNDKKKYICFISEYKKIYSNNTRFQKIKYIKFIVNCIAEFCKKNKYKLLIALRSNRIDKNMSHVDEIKFYKSFLKDDFSTNFNKNSYKVGEKCFVSIGIHSNLCYELLARGEKVFFINLNKNLYPPMYNIRKKKLIFFEKKNKKQIFIKIKKIIKLNDNNWKKYSNKISKIHFDPKNIELNNLIRKSIN